MTEKRFEIDESFKEYPKMKDNRMGVCYHFTDDLEDVELFCKQLNALVEDNEQLFKKRIELNRVSSIINKLFHSYYEEYAIGRMNFSEFSIIENIVVRLQKDFEKELEE